MRRNLRGSLTNLAYLSGYFGFSSFFSFFFFLSSFRSVFSVSSQHEDVVGVLCRVHAGRVDPVGDRGAEVEKL